MVRADDSAAAAAHVTSCCAALRRQWYGKRLVGRRRMEEMIDGQGYKQSLKGTSNH